MTWTETVAGETWESERYMIVRRGEEFHYYVLVGPGTWAICNTRRTLESAKESCDEMARGRR